MKKILIFTILGLLSKNFVANSQCLIASVSGGGSSCTGQVFPITLQAGGYLDTEVQYKLYRGTTLISSVWGFDANDQPRTSITWNQSAVGTYTVRAFGNGCSNTLMDGSAVISTSAGSVISITASGDPSSVCGFSSGFRLTASGGSGYTWFSNVVLDYPIHGSFITPEQSGTYWVTGIDICGATQTSNAITVTITSPASTPITPSGTTQRCKGSGTSNYSIPSTANATSYSWRLTNGGGSTISYSGTSATVTWDFNFTGTAKVEVTAYGCGGSAATSFTNVLVNYIDNSPTVSGGGTICAAATANIVLNGSPYLDIDVTYTLYFNGVAQGLGTRGEDAVGNPLPSITWIKSGVGIYTVIASGKGCSGVVMNGSASIANKVTPTLSLTPSGDPQRACVGDGFYLSASNNQGLNLTYTWLSSPPIDIQGPIRGTTFTPDQSATYWFTTIDNCGVTLESEHMGVTINTLPNSVLTPLSPIKICSSCSQKIDAASIPNYTYQWKKNGVDINGATSASYTANQSGAYTVTITSGAGCVSTSSNFQLSVNMLPVVSTSGNQTIVLPINSTTITGTASDPDGSVVSLKWLQISGIESTISGGTTNQLNVADLREGQYVYQVTARDDFGEENSASATIQVNAPPNNYNYVRTSSILVSGKTQASDTQNLTVDQKNIQTSYFDGLGRPMQTVSTQGSPSPSKNDIVQSIAYDSYGKESKKYLPVTVGTADGFFKPSLIDVNGNFSGGALNFYNNGLSDKIVDDARPYSETILEKSPLNRPLKDYGVGQAWAPVASGGSDKYVLHSYFVNAHGTSTNQEKVIAWIISAGLPIRTTNIVANYTVTGGYYANGQLSIKSTKDEHGNEMREYTDKQGRVVLKKVQLVPTSTPISLSNRDHWAQTYYVYDDLGNLVFVLPPELSRIIYQNDVYNPTTTDLNNWAYQYTYDYRRRMATKKIPGAQPVYMVYDLRDRLILTQDGNQRVGATSAIKYWSFTKYDELNRPIMSGIKDTTTTVQLTQKQMQDAVDAHFAKASSRWGETYVGGAAGNIHGYTNKAYPVRTGSTSTEVNPDKYLTVTYYDNYSFRNLWVGNYAYLNEGLSETVNGIVYSPPVTESSFLKSLVTGSKTKVLDGGITGGFTWLKSIVYYDDKARTVQTLSDNYKGGIDRSTTVLDFVGRGLKTKQTHNVANVTWKDLSGVSSTGNRLTRTATVAAGAASVQQLAAGQNGWIEVIVSETNTNRYIGFNDSNPDVGFTNIDYGFYLNGTTLKIIENNVTRLTLTSVLVAGDILKIERMGSAIKYYRNGTLLSYQNNAAINSALLVDVSMQSNNATLVGVRTSFSTSGYPVVKRVQYDHMGRVTKVWHTFNTEPEVLMVQNEYNELGQLVTKNTHSRNNGSTFVQSTDYRYNIRGWMEKMNDPDAPKASDLFSMKLNYQAPSATGGAPQFNGNISETILRSVGSDKQSYGYNYDAMNRLTEAKYYNQIKPTQNGRYDERIMGISGASGYSQNGNILKLQRYGKKNNNTYGLMDDLAYTYTGNQLTRVDDAIVKDANEEGFKETTKVANEYLYDANGSMTKDQNKDITAITYNHLNLTRQVNKGATDYIVYTYDATGRKLAQQVFGAQPKTTDYVGEFIYQDNVLQYILHEEGRIVPDNSAGAPRPWEYQYFIKDHLGNTRVTVSEKTTTNTYAATLEDATQTSEQNIFKGYKNRSPLSIFNKTVGGTYSQVLNGGNNNQIGLAKSFAVNPGDVIDLEVYAKYEAATSTSTTLSGLFTALAGTFTLSATGGTGVDGVQAYNAFNGLFGAGAYIGTSTPFEDNVAPKAYLNYILFDENFVLKDFGFDQISNSAAQVGVSPVTPHDYLSLHVKAQQKGFLYIYVSNENPTVQNVYFDELKITYTEGVEQVANYYAFGLAQGSNGFSKPTLVNQPLLYNGKELQDELNLGWEDYGARMYMADIGRWYVQDNKASKYLEYSPYNYALNNPIRFIDPDGNDIWDLIQDAWNNSPKDGINSFLVQDGQLQQDPKVEEIRNKYNQMITDARKNGKNFAADNLQYFIDGKGGAKNVPIGTLNNFRAFSLSVQKNQSRFEKQIEQVAYNLSDGETQVINDYWDAVVDPGVFSELYYASGKSQVTSTGRISVTRKGNEVIISGSVANVWKDPYNWNAGMSAYIPGHGDISDNDGIYLEQHGGAKSYLLTSSWSTSVSGKIIIRSNWFDSFDIKWR
jgi:RHS repeat-associated protein